MSTRSVGRVTVTALRDASGPYVTWESAFPAATQRDWVKARAADPGAFADDGRWQLEFRAFLIRSAAGTTLVDAGIGPESAPAQGWAPVPGALPQALSREGVNPSDVDTVVLTHLHSDHCGWAVTPDGDPMFPNARYVLHRDEVAWVTDEIASYVVRPLRKAGVLHEVAGETTLNALRTGERTTVIPTPGHTPGHQSVLIESGARQLIITGDVLVHSVQLVSPAVSYIYEEDPDQARETRKALLARNAELATPHLTPPFITTR